MEEGCSEKKESATRAIPEAQGTGGVKGSSV